MERNRQLMERKNEVIKMSTRHETLRDLTLHANAHKSRLKGENDMIERILKLIHLTQKMETEVEKKRTNVHTSY